MMQYCYSPNFWCSIQESIPNIIYWWASVCSKPSMDDREGLPPILVLNGGGIRQLWGMVNHMRWVQSGSQQCKRRNACRHLCVCVCTCSYTNVMITYLTKKKEEKKTNVEMHAYMHIASLVYIRVTGGHYILISITNVQQWSLCHGIKMWFTYNKISFNLQLNYGVVKLQFW